MKANTQRNGITRRRFSNGAGPSMTVTPKKTVKTANKVGLEDFLKTYPVAVFNEYGDRVISGRRIC